jgi:regulatory protein
LHLQVNQPVSKQEIDDLLQSSLSSKAYNFALRYLAARPRSKKEITDYLVKKGFEQEIIEGTLLNLEKQNYVNDADFAHMWIKNRLLLNARSPRMLRMELYKKGIEKSTIEDALKSFDEEDYQDSLKDLINKKRRQYPDDEKLMQYLVRKGYNYGEIKDSLSELAALEDEPEDHR